MASNISTPKHQHRQEHDDYFRFQCPHCSELRATVNPRNNLAHCFTCGKNSNNIDLMMELGFDFKTAVDILKEWLEDYQHDLGCSIIQKQTSAS